MNMPGEQKEVAPQKLTIAYLCRGLNSDTAMRIWNGVVAGARAQDVNLLCVMGEQAGRSLGNILYDILTPQQIDGLITWASSEDDDTSRFYDRFQNIPLVSITLPLKNRPVVTIDNYPGMYAAIAHLIEVHQSHNIAFIAGPTHHLYAQERYRAYVDVLQAYDLPLKPELMIPNEAWSSSAGHQAVRRLCDELRLQPGRDFDAVVAVNDQIAHGVIEALQARQIRVPDTIAVIGFNNSIEGRAIIPPITSVEMPFYEQGFRAVETVVAMCRGQAVAQRIELPATFVIHQSCGCLEPTIIQATVTPYPLRAEGTSREHFAVSRGAALHAMTQALEAVAATLPQGWAERLLNNFLSDLFQGHSSAFLACLHGLLRETSAAGQTLFVWQNVISALRTQLITCCCDGHLLISAENLWGQARIMIGDVIARTQLARQFQAEQQENVLRNLEHTLLTTFHISELMDVLTTGLPKLGIRSCYLALYEHGEQDDAACVFQPVPRWSRLMLAYNGQTRLPLPPAGARFRSRCLMPENIPFPAHAASLLMEPLYFKDEQLGFVVFEIETPNGNMYEHLRQDLSSALQGALLVQHVQERSAAIARQQYILDSFMANVPDSIYFKDRDSRFTRVNTAHARSVGAIDPSALLGKSDFDFFPEEFAREKYEREQEILRTGQPLLNVEERGTGERWLLTTKMPLRDEHREIIGTFGISRDITELKRAQQDLQHAYSEISLLNSQLQEENTRMSAELNVVRQLQQMILPRPQELRQISGLDIVGYMKPADEVGGDYYDVLAYNDMLHIGIGDVTGHGLESGVLMLMTPTAIRTLIEHGETDPVKFVSTLNRLIYKNAQRMQVDKTLTFVLVEYQHTQLKIVGQHEELLVIRNGGKVERIDTMSLGFPIGLEPEIRKWVNTTKVTLQPGEGIVLYTDGITEAANQENELYGIDRLCAVVSRHWNASAETIKQAIVDDVTRHIGRQKVYDDLTLVVLKQQTP